MPIVTFHLAAGQYPADRIERLQRMASRLYAEVLYAGTVPDGLERVRSFVALYPADLTAVGGEIVSVEGRLAPYFEFLVLAGRPAEQRHALLAGFTDLVVDLLGVDRSAVRGRVVQLDPDDWGIGGIPAGHHRRSEIEARAAEGIPG